MAEAVYFQLTPLQPSNVRRRGLRCALRTDAMPMMVQVRMYRMNATEARGPTLARALAASLYQGETYWLQIDGHSRCTNVDAHACTIIAGQFFSRQCSCR